MSFPIERYKFIVKDNKITALSTYAGKPVKGTAKCNPSDEFSYEVGMNLAAARCGDKIARKRLSRAEKKMLEAYDKYVEAEIHFADMNDYYQDALKEVYTSEEHLNKVLETL